MSFVCSASDLRNTSGRLFKLVHKNPRNNRIQMSPEIAFNLTAYLLDDHVFCAHDSFGITRDHLIEYSAYGYFLGPRDRLRQ